MVKVSTIDAVIRDAGFFCFIVPICRLISNQIHHAMRCRNLISGPNHKFLLSFWKHLLSASSFFAVHWNKSKMERLILSSLLLLSSVLASAVAVNGDDAMIRQVVPSDGEQSEDHLLNADHHFSLFKSKFSKTYATQEEHDYRFRVFKANLRRAKRRQLLDPTAVHGVTKFSDLTPSEFRRQFLGLNRRLRLPADAQKAPILPTNDLPTDFDWRDHGAVTGVKDQVR